MFIRYLVVHKTSSKGNWCGCRNLYFCYLFFQLIFNRYHFALNSDLIENISQLGLTCHAVMLTYNFA
jgi:hypothetical protein